jgi:hypothetical protein
MSISKDGRLLAIECTDYHYLAIIKEMGMDIKFNIFFLAKG